MLTLLVLELFFAATLFALLVYFYNEAQWQNWSKEILSRPKKAIVKQGKVPDPASYKSDGVVY